MLLSPDLPAHLITREVQCRSLLNRSGIPGVDYALNPYTGCTHGCLYCYAVFMQRFTGHSEPWGQFLDIKVNAPEVLRQQLRRASPGRVMFSTVTDPYQPAESRYGLTRACLEAFLGSDFEVSILTKSPLVLRDLDLLQRLPRVTVGFSLATLDEDLAGLLEPGAPPPRSRLAALRQLSEAGIATWLFLAPALPYFSDSSQALRGIIQAAKESGVRYLLVDTLQLYPKPWGHLRLFLEGRFPELIPLYQEYRRNKVPFREALRERLAALAAELSLDARCAF